MKTSPLILAALLGMLTGCKGEVPVADAKHPMREAVLGVLESQDRLAAHRNEAVATLATPAQVGVVWDAYCAGLERIDLSACPADFRVAFRQHTRSCREVQAAILQIPSDTEEALVMGFLNGLGGEMDGGQSRLAADLKAALQNGEATYREVERTALQYDAAL